MSAMNDQKRLKSIAALRTVWGAANKAEKLFARSKEYDLASKMREITNRIDSDLHLMARPEDPES